MSYEQRHKKCAELLREISCSKDRPELQEEYAKLCSWMDLRPISLDTLSIEQRFHEHVRLSGRSLAESDFLANLVVGDSTTAQHWLGIHTYLDGLRSCHNVGSIVRTCEAFRLGPVHLSEDMMPPDHPQLRKTSMGTWSQVTLSHGTDIELLPRPWIAVETVRGALPVDEWLCPLSCTVIFGNEERGIRPLLLKRCDAVVYIPLAGSKNSLNVANAFAIVASQIAIQQR